MGNLLGPQIFERNILAPLLSFEIQNIVVTVLIVLVFALIILNEPITYLFTSKHASAHELYESKHFWRTLVLTPVLMVPFYWLMYRYGIFEALPTQGAIGTMALQFVAMVILHDAYFYWTHRLLHSNSLWNVHTIHHQSVDPTVVTSHVFHPIEVFINFSFALWFTLVCGLMFGGLYYLPVLLFVLYTVIWNVYGHGSRNMLPTKVTQGFIARYMTWPSDHLLHHRTGRGNFGFFLSFWDRVCKTRIS
jgi:sterol desaturase/sphingolipid hydroxylase (fatty acid hydroxylase superfamily)